jgi:hypothetical protein
MRKSRFTHSAAVLTDCTKQKVVTKNAVYLPSASLLNFCRENGVTVISKHTIYMPEGGVPTAGSTSSAPPLRQHSTAGVMWRLSRTSPTEAIRGKPVADVHIKGWLFTLGKGRQDGVSDVQYSIITTITNSSVVYNDDDGDSNNSIRCLFT